MNKIPELEKAMAKGDSISNLGMQDTRGNARIMKKFELVEVQSKALCRIT